MKLRLAERQADGFMSEGEALIVPGRVVVESEGGAVFRGRLAIAALRVTLVMDVQLVEGQAWGTVEGVDAETNLDATVFERCVATVFEELQVRRDRADEAPLPDRVRRRRRRARRGVRGAVSAGRRHGATLPGEDRAELPRAQ